MKSFVLLCILLVTGLIVHAQRPGYVDSLTRELASAKEDTSKVSILLNLAGSYQGFSNPDSLFLFSQQAYKLAIQLHRPEMIAYSEHLIGFALWVMGDYLEAEKYLIAAMKFWEAHHSPDALASYAAISSSKRDKGDYQGALYYSFKLDSLDNTYDSCRECKLAETIAGSIYVELNMPDSALYYLKQGHLEWDYTIWLMGRAYEEKGNKKLAYEYYQKSFSGLSKSNNLKDFADVCISLSQFLRKEGNSDSAIYFAKTGYNAAAKGSYTKGVWKLGSLLSDIYEQRDEGEALRYHKLAMAAKDKIVDIQKATQVLNAQFNEQLQQQQAEADKINLKNRTRTSILLIALGFFLVIVVILYRSNQHKQTANAAIEKAYEELKTTQTQLIHSEKMASLGELTAGIAHEIQNPLNFVNNFSEINKELLVELREEMSKGNLNEASLLAKNVEDNQDKINEHGKRAESIVKGMLLHSRTNSGTKEPTDINKQADEYLRLSYHGFRAKDKGFNALMETYYDHSIGKLDVIPQEIGRVLLNLFNNAFYAVKEKKSKQQEGYEPVVSVSTRRAGDKVLVTVKDNGNGIPQKVVDKIFQPFFTTKPTGQGTGLGLSLAYDIVKAHGGEIKVSSVEGEFTEFIILLPT